MFFQFIFFWKRAMNEDRPPANNYGLVENNYLCVPSCNRSYFTPEECERIIKFSENIPFEDGGILIPSLKQPVSNIRKTDVRRVMQGKDSAWIFKKIMDSIYSVNRYYQYEVTGFEDLQIGRYADGGFYDWHMDVGNGLASLRKLSVTVQLSEKNAYEGGELQFSSYREYSSSKEIGSTVIFPSFLVHRVTPVTKGERWSLVAWVLGPPYR